MDSIKLDIRYAVRQLRRGGASTLISLLTIAVGIAVATIMVSVLDVVKLKPLPFREASRLVTVELTSLKERGTSPHARVVPYELFQRWNADAKSASEFAAYSIAFNVLDINGSRRSDQETLVTSNMFAFLGAKPLFGRGFVAGEDRPGAAPVAVLSFEFWKQNFGTDSGVIGRVVTLGEKPYTIVGVMPAGFHVPGTDDDNSRVHGRIFLPLVVLQSEAQSESVNVLAVLGTGVKSVAVQSELDRITASVPQSILARGDRPTRSNESEYRVTQVLPLRIQLMAEVEKPVSVLSAAVLCVLIIICANIAGMQLIRITARGREFALRTALGASQLRVGRLVFIENLILAIVGGALGVMLAVAALPFVLSAFGHEIPIYQTPVLDLRAIAAVTLAIVAMGTTFGAVSVWLANHGAQRLKMSDGMAGAGTHRGRAAIGNTIVIAEIALAMVMLGVTGLLTHSYLQLTQSERGYSPRGVVTASVTMPDAGTSTMLQKGEFDNAILARVREIPGVTHAALSHGAPLTATYTTSIAIVDSAGKARQFKSVAVFATPDYFNAIGMKLLHGRLPDNNDNNQALVIDEAAVTAYFGADNPIGRSVRMQRDSAIAIVVGVVRSISEVYNNPQNVKVRTIEPHIFVPFGVASSFTLVVRTSGSIQSASKEITRNIHELSLRALVDEPHELQATINKRYSREAVLTELAITFALLGLLISAGGLYAIVSYGVEARVREFGIRMALGARSLQITTLTMTRGAWLACTGVLLGGALTIAVSRVMRTMLFEVSPMDATSLLTSALVLLGVATLASYIPALRATKIEVVAALRND
jgi:predicted permease